jgi:hypothetical protein
MLDQIDIWRTAQLLIKHNGENARLRLRSMPTA